MEAHLESAAGRFRQLATLELVLCCGAAQAIYSRVLLGLFRGASKVGDWPLSVIAGITLFAAYGWRALAGWAAVSVLAVLVQKLIKIRYSRLRPCELPQGPPQRAPIPDRGSFPSGHTLHAVMAAIVTASLIPAVAPLFILSAFVIALSRIVLGVHYPSDVLAGAALGGIFATAFLTAF